MPLTPRRSPFNRPLAWTMATLSAVVLVVAFIGWRTSFFNGDAAGSGAPRGGPPGDGAPRGGPPGDSPSGGGPYERSPSGGAAGPVVVAAAGDIACNPADPEFNAEAGTPDACQQRATSDLVTRIGPDAVLTLGDTQYQRNTPEGFRGSYAHTWGRFRAITHPVPGNHEYKYPSAKGYFGYFGSAARPDGHSYYSFDLGAWHILALNSECDHVGGCGPGSPQEHWLRADLAAHQAECTLAYWHRPRFSSGVHGNQSQYDAFWRDLHAAGADVVLNGHDHDYERFAPLDPEGRVDWARGIREFVVGTGGVGLRRLGEREPGSQVGNDTTFGVLELALAPGGYRWRFVPVDHGTFTDSGAASCHPRDNPSPRSVRSRS